MKNRRLIVLAFMLVMQSSVVFASDVDRQTWFNGLTDNIATIGKSQKEKDMILRQRREARRNERLLKDNLAQQRVAQKRIHSQQKNILKKVGNSNHTRIGL